MRAGDSVSLLCSASSPSGEVTPIAGDTAIPAFVGPLAAWISSVEASQANWRLTRGLGLGLTGGAGFFVLIAALMVLLPRREQGAPPRP